MSQERSRSDHMSTADTVADLGELLLVERITAVCERHRAPAAMPESVTAGGDLPSFDLLGIGDDAAVVAAPDGRVVVSADMGIAGRHFRLDWSSPEQIGARVAAANLADIAAMGARPTSVVLSLGLPGDTQVSWVEELVRGVAQEAAQAGADVVGGDVVGADQVVVAATALGDLAGRSPVRRSGVQVGDVIAVAGRLGWAAAGLAVLTRGFRSPRVLVDAHRQPQPPYSAALEAVTADVHAMIDVSDGLLLDASRIAKASDVSIMIDTSRLEIAEPIAAAASAYNLDPLQWILSGGDDHALLAAFAPDALIPEAFRVIGTAKARVDAPQAGEVIGEPEPSWVLVDGKSVDGPEGFTHFI